MAKKKSAEQLMKEVEDAQKELAPELYGEEPKPSDEPVEEPTPVEEPVEEPPVEEPTEPPVSPTPEPKPDLEPEPPKLEDLQGEIKRLTDELNKEKSARGRLSVLSEERQQLNDRIAGLEKELTNLKEARKPEEPKEDPHLRELIGEYGEDSQAVKMYKTFDARMKKLQESMQGDVKTVEGKVSDVATATFKNAETRFYSDLTTAVPDWESIVVDEGFNEFLQQKIPFRKETLYDALKDAAGTFDVTTVTEIYNAYKEEKNPPAETPPNEPPPPKSKGKEKLLSPASTPKGETPPSKSEIYSPEEVKDMTVKMAKLREKGKHKEADAIQKQLDAFLDSLGNLVP